MEESPKSLSEALTRAASPASPRAPAARPALPLTRARGPGDSGALEELKQQTPLTQERGGAPRGTRGPGLSPTQSLCSGSPSPQRHFLFPDATMICNRGRVRPMASPSHSGENQGSLLSSDPHWAGAGVTGRGSTGNSGLGFLSQTSGEWTGVDTGWPNGPEIGKRRIKLSTAPSRRRLESGTA